ncbi:MAG: tyrosine-type recombinase/integrase [Terracidiphilus sp.]
MAGKQQPEKIRGVWEREPGSNVWWIRYRDALGKLRREKVGRRGDAIDLLNKRRNERRVGVKLPDNLRDAGVKFKTLADDIEEYSKAHHRDQRNIKGRLAQIRPDFDDRVADSIKPEDIDAWLTKNTRTAATSNRYRALFSLVFREALRNGKVKSNPARLVRQKHEENGVIRWLKEDEETALRAVITKHHPKHMPELDIALGTGMRLSEQYTLTWQAVDLKRKEVKLAKTKNYNARIIPMNATVAAAFLEIATRVPAAKKGDAVFPHSPRKWWEDSIAKSGVAAFRWHDCRHTFCSRLAMKGVNLKVIQVLAGHKTIAITARYAHLDDAALRAAVDLIASK